MPGPRDNRGSRPGNNRSPKGPHSDSKAGPKRFGSKSPASGGGRKSFSPKPFTKGPGSSRSDGPPEGGFKKPFGGKPFGAKPFGGKPFRPRPEGERSDNRSDAPRPYRPQREEGSGGGYQGGYKSSGYKGDSSGPAPKKAFWEKAPSTRKKGPTVGDNVPGRAPRESRDDRRAKGPSDRRSFEGPPPRRDFSGPPPRRTFDGPRADGPKPYGNKPLAGKPYGDRPYGDKPYANKPYGNKPFGAKPFRPRDNDQPAAPRYNRPEPTDRPTGWRPPNRFNDRPQQGGGFPPRRFDAPPSNAPFRGKPSFGDRNRPSDGERRPYNENRPPRDFGDRPQGDRPFRKPFGDKPFQSRPSEGDRKPFEARKPFDGDRKPLDRDRRPSDDTRRPFDRDRRPSDARRPDDRRPESRETKPESRTGTTRYAAAPRPTRDVEVSRPTQARSLVRHETAAGTVAPARRVAFEILRQVEQGAHSTDLLRERTGNLDPRDRALATELVLGVLRRRPQLDFLIRHFSERDPALTSDVRIALQMGIYQLRYLERIPTFAAVDETVEIVRALGEIPASGFVNAVLRRVTRAEVRWPDRATELCLPTWLLRRWDAQFGKRAATALGQSALQVPESYIRVPLGVGPPPGAEATEIAGCYKVTGDSSGFRFQDIGSQAIVPLLDLVPGQSYLDLAAAPGGKFLQAIETPGLLAVACDASLKRLREVVSDESIKLNRVVADATRPLPFARSFDRILLDAPCSGTGTIGRNPEIRWRVQPGDLTRYHERQVKMLSEALKLLAPGGRLVYATCSLEPEENEDVVERVARDFRGSVKLGSTIRRTPGTNPGDGFFAAVLTAVV